MFPQPPGRGALAAASVPAAAGIGLRFPHHGEVLAEAPDLPWFEVHPENYLSGAAEETLRRVRAAYPISLHATGLSLGSVGGVDPDHLAAVAALAERIEPGLVSDHLSWSAVDGLCLPDLLPLPYTDEALAVVARNIDQAQSALRRPILIENPSVYLAFQGVDYEEGDFLAALVERTGCGVLLDVNNVSVSAFNLGEDAGRRLKKLLDAIPPEAIGEIHLAGHAVQRQEDGSVVRIDDHGSAVSAEVLDLFATAIARLGPRPTLIEWDTDIPAFETLQAERARAQAVLDQWAPAAEPGRPRLVVAG
jgi:uncharacterized protein (UPF0276 family)